MVSDSDLSTTKWMLVTENAKYIFIIADFQRCIAIDIFIASHVQRIKYSSALVYNFKFLK